MSLAVRSVSITSMKFWDCAAQNISKYLQNHSYMYMNYVYVFLNTVFFVFMEQISWLVNPVPDISAGADDSWN
jgi:anaerobic C4-dicarboxylate transporter